MAVRKPSCTDPMTPPPPAPEEEDEDVVDDSIELEEDRLELAATPEPVPVPVVTADNSALNAAAAVPISTPLMVNDGRPCEGNLGGNDMINDTTYRARS